MSKSVDLSESASWPELPDADAAEDLRLLLPPPVFVSEVQSGESLLYRVRIGPMSGAGEIESVQEQLRMAGYDGGQPLP